MPTIRTECELDGYFVTAATPTQANFQDWIRTMFAQDKIATDAANSAVTTATSIQTSVASHGVKAYALAQKTSSGWQVYSGYNVTTVSQISAGGTSTGAPAIIQVTFQTPMPSVYYSPIALINGVIPVMSTATGVPGGAMTTVVQIPAAVAIGTRNVGSVQFGIPFTTNITGLTIAVAVF